MNNTERDRTLALAGVFQAAKLAQQLARSGHADDHALQTSVRSIVITDSINTISVYGGLNGLTVGLTILHKKVATAVGKTADVEIARYVLSLIQLARQLKSNDDLARTIAQRIDDIKREFSSHYSELDNEGVYAQLAQLYKDTLSTLRPKIIVQGEHGHLADAVIVDKVRTVLLAGVRSAVLWRQLGGSRWQLIFKRRALLANAAELMDELDV